MALNPDKSTLYRTIWRWHFYAGLFVVPMVLILSLTGALYLFKPQVERWEERAFQGLSTEGVVTPSAQRDAALAAFPQAMFHSYRLPERPGDAAMIHLMLADGKDMRDVFVSPQGDVLGSFDPEKRIMAIDHDIHGQLMLGPKGSWIVELAASWAIVMIATGLYLWWPRGRGIAGVLYPRGGKAFWRDMHAVTGFWVSGLAMVLLLTGLPWADVWGSGFKAVRAQMGWVKGAQDWTISGRLADGGGRAPSAAPDVGEHAGHDHMAMMSGIDHSAHTGHAMHMPDALDAVVAKASTERLPFPVIVTPPGAPQALGAKATLLWSVRSDTQDRPERVTIHYDAATAREVRREAFADKHVIDRVVGYGVAWHEGALFGWTNQLIGLLTALMLVTLSVTGFILWWRKRPKGSLGAPPKPRTPAKNLGVLLIGGFFFLTLPLFALSLLAMALIDLMIRTVRREDQATLPSP